LKCHTPEIGSIDPGARVTNVIEALEWQGDRSDSIPLEATPKGRRRLLGGLLLASILMVLALSQADNWIRLQRVLLPDRPAHIAAEVVSRTADGYCLFTVAGLVVLGLQRAQRRRASRLVMVMVLGGVLTGLVANVFRSLIGRTRPEVPVEQGWYGPIKDGHWIAGQYAYSSFPSGHTSAAAGFGLVLFLVGRRAGFAGLAYAVLVAWSRVQLGVHRPSDVAAGLCLGTLVFVAMAPTYTRWLTLPKVTLRTLRDGLPGTSRQKFASAAANRPPAAARSLETPGAMTGSGSCEGPDSSAR
jgi:membrane-associated phospholipid phosphatase